MLRVSVIAPDGKPLMPTKISRANKWIKQGKANRVYNDIQAFQVQLVAEPSGRETQAIAIGIDPGKLYTGIGVQSSVFTLWMAHLVLPFQTVKERMEQRRMMRRGRRGRRINRKLPYNQRAHRQVRFNNRKHKKVPPSIRANRQLELRIVKELCKLYPIICVVYEVVVARGDQGFSPVMVGQYWMLEQLRQLLPIQTRLGWQTANLRDWLNLSKQKTSKSAAIPVTHAVDGVTLATSYFIQWQPWVSGNARGGNWVGEAQITASPFSVIRRPPISRRQLHLMVFAKGGIRRKYGGTTTRHGVRKGDFVSAEMAGRIVYGWVSGDTKRQISVSDINWKRLGQFTARKVQLLQRSTGLLVKPHPGLSILPPLRGSN